MLRTRSLATRSGLALAALAASALLGACGGSASTASPATSSSAASGIDQKTGPEISAAAQKAALAAKSVHVKGKAGTTEIELSIDDSGAVGTVGIPGGKVDLVRVGPKYWIKAEAAFWVKSGVPAATATKLNGKFVDVSAQSAQFEGFASVQKFFGTTSQGTKATKGETSTVNGVKVIALKDTDGSTLFVALEGDPFPIRITNTGANGGQLDFSDWNVPVKVTAPTADQIIDVTTLGG